MHSRASRSILLALLLISGIAAGVFVWQNERRVQALEERRRALDAIVERVAPAASGIAAAQQAYVDYGLRDEASFQRVGTLLDQITTDAAGLRSSDYSGDGAARLEEFWAALSALTAAETQATAALSRGDALAAADALFGASRAHITGLSAELRAFHESEAGGLRASRASVAARSWMALGAVALLWVGGLFALVRLPVAREPEEAHEPPQPVSSPAPVIPVVQPSAPVTPATAETIDFTATADLCTGITQLTDTVALPGLLNRAAEILDARGIIVWMGAGDELFAAAAAGYDSAVIERLRPIRRSAENATAAAWRLGEMQTVAGGDGGLGAIVAPMFGGRDCIGVLAAEVRAGRERDAGAHAATAIIASQLAGILAAWPASSATSPASEAAPHQPGSDRQAAAS